MSLSPKLKILLMLFAFIASAPQPAWSAMENEQDRLIVVKGGDVDELLCGVHCLFIGISLVAPEKDVSFDNLIKQFPLAAKEGTSLSELKEVAENKFQLHTKIAKYSDAEIVNLPEKQVALVLLEGKPISHIVLKRPRNGGVQVLNPPTDAPQLISPEKFGKDKNLALILSATPLFPSATKIVFWVAVMLAAISLFIFGATFKFKKRKS